MGMTDVKKSVVGFKTATKTKTQSAVFFGRSKLANSRFTLKTVEELEVFLEKSLETEYTDSKTGIIKKFQHRVIIIFAETESTFFAEMLYLFPILIAKAFSQNIALKLADANMEGLDRKNYKIKSLPSIVLAQDKKVLKVLSGEEKIQKVVKSFDLDINKTIEEL